MDKQTIINKIQKLIRLRDGARAVGSEGEANAAAAAIQRLITEYNMSLSEIEGTPESEEESCIGRSNNYHTADNYRSGWKRHLLYAICEYYYCKAYMLSGTPRCVVYGTEMNRMAVEYAFNFLEAAFTHLSVIRFKESHGTCRIPTRHRDIWLASYLLGCSSGIREKLMSEETEQVTGLLISHGAMIDKYMAQEQGSTGSWSSSSNRGLNGRVFGMGYRDGQKQNIAKAIK